MAKEKVKPDKETVAAKDAVKDAAQAANAAEKTAKRILIGSFLNLRATADFIEKADAADLLLVCSGTFDQAAYEDILGAGALCERLWSRYKDGAVADSVHMARRLFKLDQDDLLAAVAKSRNGQRLMMQTDLKKDVAFCVQRDVLKLVVEMGKDGVVRIS